jgi:hypothetical protein
VTALVRVRNTGDRAREEIVRIYLHDFTAWVTRPVKQLAGFIWVRLGPGEEAEVSFRLHPDRTTFTGGICSASSSPGTSTFLSSGRWGPATPGPATADRANSHRESR